jgi:hypothetical protein
VPASDDHLVHATWNRRFWRLQILAFADHAYLINFGTNSKPPLMTLGWCRWYSCPVTFLRFRKVGA